MQASSSVVQRIFSAFRFSLFSSFFSVTYLQCIIVLVIASSNCWPEEPLLLTCQHGLLWEACNAGGPSCYLLPIAQQVRRTCFLGGWKIPMGGEEQGQNVAWRCSAGRFPLVGNRKHHGWGCIHIFPSLFGQEQLLFRSRTDPFSPVNSRGKFYLPFSTKWE